MPTSSTFLTPTTTPPLLNVPTYSLATTSTTTNNDDNDEEITTATTMNILTYATPIGATPYRTWAISLYKNSLSHDNFCKTGFGILQLLTKRHVPLVRYLGGASGRDVDKKEICEKIGFPWQPVSVDCKEEKILDEKQQRELPHVLPHCKSYLLLSQQGELIDVGSHTVAICRVEDMLIVGEEEENEEEEDQTEILMTAYLRKLGLITNLGRVADPPFSEEKK